MKTFKTEVVTLDNPLMPSRNYQKLVAKIEGKPEERILSYLMLRDALQADHVVRDGAVRSCRCVGKMYLGGKGHAR